MAAEAEAISDEMPTDPRTRGQLVDMTGAARDCQFDGAALKQAGFLKIIAPAKVNLLLAVGGRRPDGKHDAKSLMQALNLHDVLYMGRMPYDEACELRHQLTEGSACAISASEDEADHKSATCKTATRKAAQASPGRSDVALAGPCNNILVKVRMLARGATQAVDIPAEHNIVVRAIDLLARAIDMRNPEAISLIIEKAIPCQGGLGGGSSDAAAALLGAARLWGIDAKHPAIEEAARRLGSDVPFFLRGGCGLYAGTGDEFVRALEPAQGTVVLIKPEGGVSTAGAYAAFDEQPTRTDPEALDRALHAAAASEVPLFNNLAAASERLMPALGTVRTWALDWPGVTGVLLCGSGATTFATCNSFSDACAIVGAAKQRGWWARATSFGRLGATILP